jgi:hypothetical protein
LNPQYFAHTLQPLARMAGAAKAQETMGRRRGRFKLALAWILFCALGPACLAQSAAESDALRARRETQARAAEARNSRLEEQARAEALKAAPLDPIPWRQVTPEELAMTAEPRAPGASAIYLYTQIDQDHQNRAERIYQQIKVLADEGRNRANIQLPYRDPHDLVDGISARVIQPDGTIVEFRDKVYDRPLAVNRGTGWRAKSFALPDVRVGSVIEFQFYRRWKASSYTWRWVLNQDLYTRHGRYALQHPSWGDLKWSLPKQLPPGTTQPVLEKGVVRMETRDMPEFVIEPFMPPADDLAVFVEFNWLGSENARQDTVAFWRDYGRGAWKLFEEFMGKPRDVADVLAGILAPDDTATQKAVKIYEHVRQVRNIQMEDPALRTERDIELYRKSKDVRSLMKNGIGSSGQLQLYFVALARAAGLEASSVEIASRKVGFFDPSLRQTDGLDGRVAVLRLDGRDVFVDPASGILPFGQLHWFQTGVPGLKLDKDGGQWITTPAPRPADAVTRRSAALELSADGAVEGKLEIRYSGHEAAWRIQELRYVDAETRRQFLQDEVRQTLATRAEVALVREPDWNDSDGIIEVTYQIKLPEWVTPAGNRMLVGVGLFGALERLMFTSAERRHPIYIEYPATVEDQIEIILPPGFSAQGAPGALPAADPAFVYSLIVTPREGAVNIRRTMAHSLFLVPAVHYPRIRTFFQGVRTGDETQVVIAR